MYHKPTKKDPKIGKKSVFVSNPRLKHNVTVVAVSAPIITLRQAQPKDNRRMVITTCCSIVHIYINMYKRIINRERDIYVKELMLTIIIIVIGPKLILIR